MNASGSGILPQHSSLKSFLEAVSFLEPTNNIAPKKDGDMKKITGYIENFVLENNTCWLSCQVTGYPVPRYL